MPVQEPPRELLELMDRVRQNAQEAGVFGTCAIHDGMLVCSAVGSAEEAFYRLELDGDRLWVSLVMADRWQSGSIEGDLMHLGDKLEDLIQEELLDLECHKGPLPFEHFRSQDMLFTFRSPVPIELAKANEPESIETATACLLAYEACFSKLGDMAGGDEED